MVAGDDQELVRDAAPVRADDERLFGGEHDPGAVDELGLDRGADDAAAVEPAEGPLLVEDLTGHERHPEELPVGMRERRAGFAAVVHDRLGVADVRRGGVLDEPVAQRDHQVADLAVAQVAEVGVVLGREHEHLVDAARLRLDVHRAEVAHRQALVTLERGIEVRHDAKAPTARVVDRLERRRCRLFVARAEGAGTGRIGVDTDVTGGEIGRPLGARRDDGHPPSGQRVQTQLTHCSRGYGVRALVAVTQMDHPSQLLNRLIRPPRPRPPASGVEHRVER